MIVAFLNQKGGVGKTTLALHLAGEWSREGERVTLIDADPHPDQQHLADSLKDGGREAPSKQVDLPALLYGFKEDLCAVF